MLTLAAKHYLKSIGDHDFVPNPDYADWLQVSCLNAVIKRKPRWIWQKDIYTNDKFGLDEILDSPIDKSKLLKAPEKMTSNYEWSIKQSAKGKLGAKIASLLSLDVGGNDTISLSIKMEGLMKQSIDFAAVSDALKTKKVNITNRYVRHVARDKYNVICLVSQYIYLSQPMEVKFSLNWDIDEIANVDKDKVNVDDTADIKTEKIRSITFDAGTRLAFDFAECLIKSDGRIELIDRSEGVNRINMIPRINDSSLEVKADKFTTKKNYDFVDCGPGQLTSHSNGLTISKTLIQLMFEDKTIFKQFELFLIEVENFVASGSEFINLSTSNISGAENSHLSSLLKEIGLDTKNANDTVKTSQVKSEMVFEVLIKVQSIYHLEESHLKNILDILIECDSELKGDLFSYLQNLVNPNYSDAKLHEKFLSHKKTKILLLSIGLVDRKFELNEYFQPTVNLFYGA